MLHTPSPAHRVVRRVHCMQSQWTVSFACLQKKSGSASHSTKKSGLLPHLSRSCVSPLADAAVAHTHWRRSDPPYGIRWKAVSGTDPPDGTWQVGRVELTPLLDHGMQKSLGSEPKGGTLQSDSHITSYDIRTRRSSARHVELRPQMVTAAENMEGPAGSTHCRFQTQDPTTDRCRRCSAM